MRQDLQALEMPRQLEHTKHPHQTYNSQNGKLRRGRDELDVVGQNGEEVDNVAELLHEFELVRRGQESHDKLHGEPHRAYALDNEQLVVFFRLLCSNHGHGADRDGCGDVWQHVTGRFSVLQDYGGGQGHVHALALILDLRQCLDAEQGDRYDDDYDGDDGYDAR